MTRAVGILGACLWHRQALAPCMSMSVVAIDPFFPFQPRLVSTFSITAPAAPRTTHAGSLGISVAVNGVFFAVNPNLLTLSLYRNNQFTICTYPANDWYSMVSWQVRLRSRLDLVSPLAQMT